MKAFNSRQNQRKKKGTIMVIAPPLSPSVLLVAVFMVVQIIYLPHSESSFSQRHIVSEEQQKKKLSKTKMTMQITQVYEIYFLTLC
mmetsp:Transcript_20102/g.30451  ORF Transcript_20102/g.30451 Transcript_20102/m.30451 type:complete len:86 (+) Transcript_20102:247-504(+)